MGSHQFDKQIKDKLQFHKSGVDPVLWDKIEAHLPGPESSRRIPIWWITSIIVLTGVALSGLYIWNQENQKNTKETDTNTVIAASESTLQNQSFESTTPFSTESSTSTNGQLQVATTTPEIAHLHAGREQQNQSSTSHPVTKKPTSTKQNTIARQNNDLIQREISNATPERSNHSSSNEVKQSDISEILWDRLHSLPTKSVADVIAEKQKRVVIKDHCLDDFNHGRKGVVLELYYGNDFPIRTMEARSDEYVDIVNARKETESSLYSFSLGARLGFHLSKQFKLLTGVHYGRINEKFEFVDPESSQVTIVQTKVYIKDANGMIKDSTFTYDTVNTPGTLIYKIRNQYSTFDIPFLVGIKAFESDKINIYINAGVMANLVFKKEGMSLVNDRYIVRGFNDEASSSFHHSLGLSTYIGAQFAYKWQPGFHFFLEPNVRIHHRSLTTKDYPVKHQYTIPSVAMGARYNF